MLTTLASNTSDPGQSVQIHTGDEGISDGDRAQRLALGQVVRAEQCQRVRSVPIEPNDDL